MLPRFAQISLCLFIVEDNALMHATLPHASTTPFPPTSGSGNMPAPRHLFLVIVSQFWLRAFAFKDAPTVLPECLCGHAFRFGLTPYNPVCVIPELNEALLLVLWT
jgi:hypothetical protein